MKPLTLLYFGVILFVAGFTVKAESENWSLDLLPAGMSSSTRPVYTVDETKRKTYYSTGEELAVLAIILIGISAINGRVLRKD